MERVARGFDTGPIERGLARIPPRIRELVGPIDFLCGVDPLFVGLHHERCPDVAYGYPDGTSYAEVAHYVSTGHQPGRPRSERAPTVVFPTSLELLYGLDGECGAVVAHEFGHRLDEVTGAGSWPGAAEGITPVSESAVNWWEAYAEAFTAWLYPELYPCSQSLVLHGSPVLAHFEGLAS